MALLTPPRVSDPAFEPAFRSLGADVAVVMDFGEILKPFVFEWAPHGFLGVHPSLLPRWRGAAPIQWSILAGDETTGVSIFRLSAAVDAGQLALRLPVPIAPRETAPELQRRLSREGARALEAALHGMEEGTLQFAPQPGEEAPIAPKLRRADGVLWWHEDARALDRRVRALLPWPCAWFPSARGAIKVTRAFPIDRAPGSPPGTVLGIGEAEGEEGVRIACGRGELLLLEVQRPGRHPLGACEWFRGARLPEGMVLPCLEETGQ